METASNDLSDDHSLRRLEEALTAASTRAPFAAYLRCEFEAFTCVISRVGPRWDIIAKWAQEEGHTNGKEMTPAAARKAYNREKERRAARGIPLPEFRFGPLSTSTTVESAYDEQEAAAQPCD